MFVFLVVVLLVAILIVLVLMYRRQPAPPEPEPPPQNHVEPQHRSLLEASVGDVVLVPGAGDSYSDLSMTVDRRNRYEGNGETWYELSGRYKGRRVFVEVIQGDDLEVLLNSASDDVALADLGLTEDDLIRMDESHDRSESFSYAGSQWRFEWSGEIRYFEADSGAGEGYYSWDFREQGGRRALSVEKWEGEPFEVAVAQHVNADDVQVFRK